MRRVVFMKQKLVGKKLKVDDEKISYCSKYVIVSPAWVGQRV